MLSRMFAILISSWLPALGLILPVSATHRANALIAGTVATVLSALSLVDRRARFAAAVVAAWVTLSPFVIDSTLLEMVMTAPWGIAMFTWLIGPFSAAPEVTWVKRVAVPSTTRAPEVDLPHAA